MLLQKLCAPCDIFIMITQPMKGHMPLQRPITLNMGMRMNAWSDLTSLDKINADEDELGLRESMK